MRIAARRLGIALALALMLATSASAERRWFVAGNLDGVDEETSTITVEDTTITINRSTLIKDENGAIGSWEDIEARDGDYVSALVSQGHPHPVAETLLLEDAELDGGE